MKGGKRNKRSAGTILPYLAPVLAGLAMLISVAALLGRGSVSPLITFIRADWKPMPPASALSFLLMGTVLLLRLRKRDSRLLSRIQLAFTLLVLLFNAIILIQYLFAIFFGLSLDIEQIFGAAQHTESGYILGRMSPITALLFLLSASYALISSRGQSSPNGRQPLAAFLNGAVFLLAGILVVGYWYEVPFFYAEERPVLPVSLSSSVAFLLLSSGFFFEDEEALFSHWLTSPSIFSRFTRWVIPGTVTLTLLFGRLHIAAIDCLPPAYHALLLFLEAFFIASSIVLLTVITARQTQKAVERVEQARRQSERRYATLVEVSPAGIFRTDARGRTTYVSPRWCEIAGLDAKTALGHGWLRAVHPADRQKLASIWKQAAETGHLSTAEYRFLRPDGSVRWVRGQATPERNARGKIVGYIGVLLDVTEVKLAEEARRASEARYRGLFEDSPISLWEEDFSAVKERLEILREQGVQDFGAYFEAHPDFVRECASLVRIRDVNRAALRLYHAVRKEDLIENLTVIFGEETYSQFQEELLRITGGNTAFELDGVNYTLDGKRLDVSINWAAVPGHESDLKRVIVSITDITERKRAAERREILHHLSQEVIQKIGDPEAVYESIYQAARKSMPVDNFTIAIHDEARGEFEGVYLIDEGKRYPNLRAAIQEGISGHVIRTGRTLRIGDVTAEKSLAPVHFGSERTSRAWLCVPLRLGERIIGALSAQSYQPNVYSTEDESLFEMLAAYAAPAIENARLLDAERRARAQSEKLRQALEAGAALSAMLDVQSILEHLLERLEQFIPFDGANVMLVEPKSGQARLARLRGYRHLSEEERQRLLAIVFDIETTENLRWMAENHQPYVIPDVQQFPAWVDIAEARPTRSWAGAPIIIDDEVIAFFSLDSNTPGAFNEDHARLLQAFAGQAALALHNARLFQQTRQHAENVQAIGEMGHALSETFDIPRIYDQVRQTVYALLSDISGVMINLYDEQEQLILPSYCYTDDAVQDVSSLPPIPLAPPGEGTQSRVIHSRQPLVINHFQEQLKKSRIRVTIGSKESPQRRSSLYVPMLTQGKVIGLVIVQSPLEERFQSNDIELMSLIANTAAVAIENARLFDETQRQVRFLSALHTIDVAISASVDLRVTANIILEHLTGELNVDAAAVALLNPHTHLLEFIASRGFRSRLVEGTTVRVGNGLAGEAALQRQIVSIPRTEGGGNRQNTDADLFPEEEFVSQYAIPLIAKGEVRGVLQVCHRSPLNPPPEWLEFLNTLAGQTALAIDNTHMFDELQRSHLELLMAYDATIRGWSQALEMRDRETEGHTQRVTDMTVTLAGALGMNDAELEHVRRGALLHDIGKIGIPDAILHKASPLTEQEQAVMRLHPVKAFEVLSTIPYLLPALDIPYCHHEKWDGSGYPRGLKGEQIPLAARIFAVVDVFDALTSDRPYRPAWSRGKAIEYIKEQAGKHFDPRVVEAFLKMMQE